MDSPVLAKLTPRLATLRPQQYPVSTRDDRVRMCMSKRNMIQAFQYPVTRPINLNYWAAFFLAFVGVLWIVVVTVINVIAVGYELVPVTSTTFNDTMVFWYYAFSRASWLPKGRNCQGSILKQREGSYPLRKSINGCCCNNVPCLIRLPADSLH